MDILEILAELHGQRDRISKAIEALESLKASAPSPKAKTGNKPAGLKRAKQSTAVLPAAKKRVVSPEARKRMAEAQKKRWAAKKKTSKPTAIKKSTNSATA
jgi:peptidoglycan hydrolase CwlO-like protein